MTGGRAPAGARRVRYRTSMAGADAVTRPWACARRDRGRPPLAWAPWAAAMWAASFAAGSVYLAAGGTRGLGLLAVALSDRIHARDPVSS